MSLKESCEAGGLLDEIGHLLDRDTLKLSAENETCTGAFNLPAGILLEK